MERAATAAAAVVGPLGGAGAGLVPAALIDERCARSVGRVLSEATRREATEAERSRVLRILEHMVYNPMVFSDAQLQAITWVVSDIRLRVLDPREGVNPFPLSSAGVLSEAGELVQPGGPVRGVNDVWWSVEPDAGR